MAKPKTKLEKMSKKERTSLAYALATNLAKHGTPQTPKNERKLTKGEIEDKEDHVLDLKKSLNLEVNEVKNNDATIARLEKERKRLMSDMEQEAEPEGGPIANRYGRQLNRIDKALNKLQGRKEMTYDQAIAKSVNEGLAKKLNKELGYDSNAGTFAEDTFDKDDAEFHGIKPGKYIKFYIEDVKNSSILKVKRLAKSNGLKFVHDAEDMLLFREPVNEGPGQKHYTKDGKEWTGPTHKMPDGTLMTGDPHNKDSEKLSHESVKEIKKLTEGMQKSEFIEKIKTLAKQAYANKIDQPEIAKSKFPMIDEFPPLKGVMEDLFDFQYEPFVKDVEWVAPRPTTFRIRLVNGADFYLIYDGIDGEKGLFSAQVSGKKYFLESLPEEQQASEAIARLLRYKFADTGKEETETEDDWGGEEGEKVDVEVEATETEDLGIPLSVEDL